MYIYRNFNSIIIMLDNRTLCLCDNLKYLCIRSSQGEQSRVWCSFLKGLEFQIPLSIHSPSASSCPCSCWTPSLWVWCSCGWGCDLKKVKRVKICQECRILRGLWIEVFTKQLLKLPFTLYRSWCGCRELHFANLMH